MEEIVQLDFRSTKVGSEYSPIINEGTSQSLMGMLYRNPYTDPNERAAFDFGRASGDAHVKAIRL